jgi:hypothetical protein
MCNLTINNESMSHENMHNMLGHCSDELTVRTAKHMKVKLKRKKRKCVSCASAKARKKAIKKSTKTGWRTLVSECT